MNPFAEFAAIVGIDWADKKHDLCLKPLGSDRLEFAVLTHTPEAIDDWVNGLRQRFGGAPIAVCLESRKVPLIHALLKYDFLALIPVNPQTLARYRRALRPSRAPVAPQTPSCCSTWSGVTLSSSLLGSRKAPNCAASRSSSRCVAAWSPTKYA